MADWLYLNCAWHAVIHRFTFPPLVQHAKPHREQHAIKQTPCMRKQVRKTYTATKQQEADWLLHLDDAWHAALPQPGQASVAVYVHDALAQRLERKLRLYTRSVTTQRK